MVAAQKAFNERCYICGCEWRYWFFTVVLLCMTAIGLGGGVVRNSYPFTLTVVGPALVVLAFVMSLLYSFDRVYWTSVDIFHRVLGVSEFAEFKDIKSISIVSYNRVLATVDYLEISEDDDAEPSIRLLLHRFRKRDLCDLIVLVQSKTGQVLNYRQA